MRPRDARACVTARERERERLSEGEMKSSRQRITDPGHVSGVAAAGPLSCYNIRSARTASTIARGLTFFSGRIYNIVLYTVLYFYALRATTDDAERACVYARHDVGAMNV